MTKTDENIIAGLKTLINSNGPHYLTDNPYSVYEELRKVNAKDRKINGAILCFLVSSIAGDVGSDMDPASLSKKIQEKCGFNQEVADRIAVIFSSLYSQENEEEWKSRDGKGLSEFLRETFICKWKGFTVWQVSNGSVDCHYQAEITLTPTKTVSIDAKLKHSLKKNPFMTKAAIQEYFEKQLCEYLDWEFEEYCTCDDYYEPVVEDFEIESCIAEWCKKNGFKLVSCEGEGHDDGYEPSFRRGW